MLIPRVPASIGGEGASRERRRVAYIERDPFAISARMRARAHVDARLGNGVPVPALLRFPRKPRRKLKSHRPASIGGPVIIRQDATTRANRRANDDARNYKRCIDPPRSPRRLFGFLSLSVFPSGDRSAPWAINRRKTRMGKMAELIFDYGGLSHVTSRRSAVLTRALRNPQCRARYASDSPSRRVAGRRRKRDNQEVARSCARVITSASHASRTHRAREIRGIERANSSGRSRSPFAIALRAADAD